MKFIMAILVALTCAASAATSCNERLGGRAQAVVKVLELALNWNVLEDAQVNAYAESGRNPFANARFHELKARCEEAFSAVTRDLDAATEAEAKAQVTALLARRAGLATVLQEAARATERVLAPRELPAPPGNQLPPGFKSVDPFRHGRKVNPRLVRFYDDKDHPISEFHLPSRTGEVTTVVMPGPGSGLAHAIVIYQTDFTYGAYLVDVTTGMKIQQIKINNPGYIKLVYVNGQPYLYEKRWPLGEAGASIRLVDGKTRKEMVIKTATQLENIAQFHFRGSDYLVWREEERLAVFDPLLRKILYVPAAKSDFDDKVSVYEYNGDVYAVFGPGVSSYFQLTWTRD